MATTITPLVSRPPGHLCSPNALTLGRPDCGSSPVPSRTSTQPQSA
jgi:hypothetical protein